MRHVRMLALCIVAALAAAAIAATSASALPEWGKCVVQPNHEGKFTDSNCTKKAKKVEEKFTGGFEWIKGKELAPVPFTGRNAGAGGILYSEFGECSGFGGESVRATRQACEAKGGHRISDGSGAVIECTAENDSGEASGTKEVKNVSVTFKGCKALGTVPCENVGPEEIKTNALKGSLGYISKSKKEVGLMLTPAKSKGAFANFVCPGLGITSVVGVGNEKEGAVQTTSGCTRECPGTKPEEEKHGGYDGVISPITPVNLMTTTYTQEFKVINGEPGSPECVENTPSKFEGKHIDVLEWYGDRTEEPAVSLMWSCAGEEITAVNTPAEAGEIKA